MADYKLFLIQELAKATLQEVLSRKVWRQVFCGCLACATRSDVMAPVQHSPICAAAHACREILHMHGRGARCLHATHTACKMFTPRAPTAVPCAL